jgi:septal ring factor EnvC (AmiA/AmiB activator)
MDVSRLFGPLHNAAPADLSTMYCPSPPQILVFLTLLVSATFGYAAEKASDKQAELKELKARIESIRKNIEVDTQRRDAMAGELKNAELAVQSARTRVAEIRTQRLASERALAELRRDQSDTTRQIAMERNALAAQLRAAYMAGDHEPLVLVLNQQNPGELSRMLGYYGYFARARAEQLNTITDRLAHLELLTERASAETERLKEFELAQAKETKRLAEARKERAETLASIQTKIRSRAEEAAQLERQAQALSRLIEELQRAARDFPKLPNQDFARTKGKLPWPVNGKVLANFGDLRAGGPLKWEGVLIGAASGTQVRAIFHGRVIYADYLYGMGLMVIVDHGDGYSSIYGHNEQLYCKVGDTVAPGDVLGTLGEPAGAEERVALHFELRKGKQPLDTRQWLRKM